MAISELMVMLLMFLSILNISGFAQQVSLSGTITNVDGIPLVGITVAIQQGAQQTEVLTDTIGSYSVSLNPGSYDQLRIRNMFKEFPKVPKTIEYVARSPLILNSNTVIDVKLHQFPRIAGRIFSPDSSVLENVYLEGKMWTFGSQGVPWDNSASDSTGNYELFLDSGQVKIWVTAPTGNPNLTNFDFTLTRNNDTILDIYFPEPNILSGYVYTHDSISVKNATVAIEQGPNQLQAFTDSTGYFSYGLQPGIYRVRVRNMGQATPDIPKTLEYTYQESVLVNGETSVYIYLPKFPRFSGSVRDTAGRPVAGVLIEGKQWVGSETVPWDDALSDSLGQFTLFLGKGMNKIWVYPVDSLTDYTDHNFLINLPDDLNQDIILIPAAIISGIVMTADSTPVAGLTVAIQKGADQPEVKTDSLGFYSIKVAADTFDQLRIRNLFTDIPAIPKVIEQVIEAPFIVTGSMSKNVVLPRYPRLYGTILTPDANPASGVFVESKLWQGGAESPPWDNDTTQSDGQYELFLGQGINRVQIVPGGVTYGSFSFLINADTDLIKEIILPLQAKGLTRIQPSVITVGETGEIIITGVNSNFMTNQVVLDLGDSISVDYLEVLSPISLKAWITVSPNAETGIRTLIATSWNDKLVGPELLTITAPHAASLALDNTQTLTADVMIGDGTGTEIKIDSGTVVYLPAPDDTMIAFIAPLIKDNAVDPVGADFLQIQRDFYPDGIAFEPPAILTFHYGDQDVEGVREDDLKVYKYDNDSGRVEAEYKVTYQDTAKNLLSHEVSGFSLFRLAENKTAVKNKPLAAVQTDMSILVSTTPNPFTPRTVIAYHISGEDHQSRGSIQIFDLNGKLIKTVIQRQLKAGHYNAVWPGIDEYGNRVAAGQYYCHLNIGKVSKVEKLVLIK